MQFGCNGLKDCLSQTVNEGTPTQYTLDLNAGLTQVTDGTNTYAFAYNCGGKDFDYGSFDVIGDTITQNVSCTCDARWYDSYTLDGAEIIE